MDDYDPFEVDYRVVANMNDFGYENGCTFFRYDDLIFCLEIQQQCHLSH